MSKCQQQKIWNLVISFMVLFGFSNKSDRIFGDFLQDIICYSNIRVTTDQ